MHNLEFRRFKAVFCWSDDERWRWWVKFEVVAAVVLMFRSNRPVLPEAKVILRSACEWD